MYTTLISAVALFAAPAFAAFAISSPELKQCEVSRISWEKTTPGYNLIAVSAADPCGEPLVEIGDFEKSFVDWKVTLPAGTVIQLSVADKNDDEAWSGNITIGASSDASCLPGAPAVDTPTTPDTPTSNTNTNAGSSTTDTTSTDTTTDSNGAIIPVGAANAGTNGLINGRNSASAASFSKPILALSAIAGLAALAL